MTWQTEWRAIAARIESLRIAIQIVFDSAQNDYYGVCGSYLVPQSNAIYRDVQNFVSVYKKNLPLKVADALQRFDGINGHVFGKNNALAGANGHIGLLCGLKAEFEYLLSDSQVQIRKSTERAFVHLQRLIVADSQYQQKWTAVTREIEYEKLGGVHLLLHGIWGFKVDATGGRSDLVLGTPITLADQIPTVAEGLVLTEWKKVTDVAKAMALGDDAIVQAELYSSGILAGFELSDTRYIVLVSNDVLPSRLPETRAAVTYKFVNIAVNPAVPSIAAKTQLL